MQTKFICKDCFTVLEKYMLQIRGLQLKHFRGFLRDGVTLEYRTLWLCVEEAYSI